MLLLLLSLIAAAQEGTESTEPVDEEPAAEPAEPPAEPTPAVPPAEPTPVEPPPVSAARLCADAAEGAEVEVCVRLAVDNPTQIDNVIAALRAHVDRGADADRGFLSALVLLLSEDTGPDGAARLGKLGDVRAVAPLAHAGETRSVPVAVAAAHALANYSEGLEPLSRWLTNETLPMEVRVAASHSLGELGKIEGADAIMTALRRRGLPPALREAMLSTIRTQFPEMASDLVRQTSSDGAPYLAVGGAWALGHALGMGGRLGQSDSNAAVAAGIVGGSVGGATFGWLAGSAWPMERKDAAFVSSNIIAGSVGGALIGASLVDDPNRANAGWVGGFVLEGVGLGAGLALREKHQGSQLDTLQATGVAASTSVLAYSIAFQGQRATESYWQNRPHTVRAPQLAAGLGLLAGHSIGHAVAPKIDLEDADGWMMVLGVSYGGGASLLLPFDLQYPELMFAAGTAAGALTSYGLAATLHPDNQAAWGGASSMVYGSWFGLGAGMLIDPDNQHNGRVWRGSALAVGTLGMGLGSYVGAVATEEIDNPDVAVVALLTGWATWNSAAWFGVVQPQTGHGWYVLLPATAGIATGAITPLIEVPLTYTFSSLSLGAWGGYLGAVTADLSDERYLLRTVIGSDIGFVLGVAMAAPPISSPPLVIGLADAGGVVVGSSFALGAAMTTEDRRTILTASLIGAGIGFGGGLALGTILHKSGATRDTALLLPLPRARARMPGTWAVAPAAFPDPTGEVLYGGQLTVTEW